MIQYGREKEKVSVTESGKTGKQFETKTGKQEIEDETEETKSCMFERRRKWFQKRDVTVLQLEACGLQKQWNTILCVLSSQENFNWSK